MLSGKKVLVIICGGIAAYKALELIRRLKNLNAQILPVMTSAAKNFVTEMSVGVLAESKVYSELFKILKKLEKHYKDMQDVEFTVENKKLWMLQTRSGKRTAKSAVKIAVDMVKEKLITKKDAILRIEPSSLDTLLHPTLDEKANLEVIGLGLPASPGAASGKVVFTSEEAERLNSMMQSTILVRVETSPEDIHGMHAAKGILTSRGGTVSYTHLTLPTILLV